MEFSRHEASYSDASQECVNHAISTHNCGYDYYVNKQQVYPLCFPMCHFKMHMYIKSIYYIIA